MNTNLLAKYDVPVPRYTSYPTIPYWSTDLPNVKDWKQEVKTTFTACRSLSLYIHLPFCENLCTYCGCNKYITKNHQVEHPYIDCLLKEWSMYLESFDQPPIIKELHLGGGTPTFFQPEQLERLIRGILDKAYLAEDYEFSFEAHPSNTSTEHLNTLYDLGFRRLSIGVQDFSDDILRLINRKQRTEQVEQLTLMARKIGYTSINFDLIFGLPTQTTPDIQHTLQKVKALKPDRIAFYSYAHVPWIKPSQRAYSEKDLPKGEEKRNLYSLGKSLLEEIGYKEIGMDHFALPQDSLYTALQKGQLHRNFMGYSSWHTDLMIGLGASAISDSWSMYAQNEKNVKTYQLKIMNGELPLIKNHKLSREDQIIRLHILNLMCRNQTTWHSPALQCEAFYEGLERLKELEQDGLVIRSPFKLEITKTGRTFMRNICMAFDAAYWRKKPEDSLFSQAI